MDRITTLMSLTQIVPTDDLSKHLPTQISMNPSLQAKLKEIEQRELDFELIKAAQIVKDLLNEAQEKINEKVNKVREYREMEKQLLSEIKNISEARDYGNETMQYLPLEYLINTNTLKTSWNQHVVKKAEAFIHVPAEWKAKNKAAKVKPVVKK